LIAAALIALTAAASTGAEKEPGTGPWELRELKKTPKHEVAATEQVKEGDHAVTLTSLYYEGEPWLGKPTRVFAYYARPADLPEKRVPAMLLLHGGGGTAYTQ